MMRFCIAISLDMLRRARFIGDLPKDVGSFCEAWRSEFPEPLLDTRHVAMEGRYHLLQVAGGLSLENLHRHLTTLEKWSCFEAVGQSGEAHGSAGQDDAFFECLELNASDPFGWFCYVLFDCFRDFSWSFGVVFQQTPKKDQKRCYNVETPTSQLVHHSWQPGPVDG